MLQIKYPKDPKDRNDLEQLFINAISTKPLAKKLKEFFDQKGIAIPNPPTLDKLLVMPLEKLYLESQRLNKYINTPAHIKKLKHILNYDKPGTKQQPKIGRFFADNDDKIKLLTCYYCNIDYINAFENFNNFKDSLVFINKATKFELTTIQGIDDQKAETIMKLRKSKVITNINRLPYPFTDRDKSNIKNLMVKKKSSHFTLDHVIDKSDFPSAAISLYNFVPSCYSCNSKFKRKSKLISTKAKIFLSPTSVQNVFIKEFSFKLLFSQTKNSDLKRVNSLNDFDLDFDFKNNSEDYQQFLSIFRLHSRYVLHKREILSLISKKKKYSDSHIKKIAKLVNIGEEKVKKDIFGKELFEGDLEDYPLTKLKRDIARNIKIQGVIQ